MFGGILSIKFNTFKRTCHTSPCCGVRSLHRSPILAWLQVTTRAERGVAEHGWCGSGWFRSSRKWWLWDHSLLIQVYQGLSPSTCSEWFFECFSLARLHAVLWGDGLALSTSRLSCLGGLWIACVHAAVAASNGILVDCAIVCRSPHHRGVFTDPWAVVGGFTIFINVSYISFKCSTRFSPRNGMIISNL